MVDEDASTLEDPQQFINMVTKWLNQRSDWLMVLDGKFQRVGESMAEE